ncbi:trypsin-like peptidase domain-containing protein [Candidatus Sumerlaeota bacterium]|nr:trypsin-like peptidase domain-containing protein [Candidatus Sumerlaeota bacterium]
MPILQAKDRSMDSKRTLGAALLVTALMAAGSGEARADREAMQKFVADKGAAIVTLECVFEIKMNYGGQQQESERKRETDGFIVDEKGMVVTALSNVDPGAFYAKAMDGEENYTTRLKSLKYVFPDNTEMPASVVLRDSDLDIAVVKPLVAPEKPMTFISLSESAKPKILSEAYAVGRLGRIARRNIVALSGEVQSIVEKPRTFYIGSSDINRSDSAGVAVFDENGKLYGMTSLYLFPGGRAARGDSDEPYISMIVPAEDLQQVAEQAKDAKPEEQPAAAEQAKEETTEKSTAPEQKVEAPAEDKK